MRGTARMRGTRAHGSRTLAMLAGLSLATGTTYAVPAEEGAGTRFEITYPEEVLDGPVTGRAFLIVSRSNEKPLRLQVGRTGVPFFGRDFEGVAPNEPILIDANDLGSPVRSLSEIPAGEYFVQAGLNVYSEFRRADGHVVWLHDDQWDGQDWRQSPGNVFSAPTRLRLDPNTDAVHRLVVDQKIPPIELPPDTVWVKRFRFESRLLTEFWGRPIYLGATVLLPRDYDRDTTHYPVVYYQGHFSIADPMNFKVGKDFYNEWTAEGFPRMIVVTFQDPTPYFDTSYSVNSVNVGPYGDALMEELIPEVEERFRIIREPYARVLTGGSTGGWESLAMQIFHPDFFGGTFSYAPDPVTFVNVEGIDIYEDQNAFFKQHEWRRVPIANTRELTGEIRMTSRQRNQFELVSGTRGRSGQQLDIWSAVYGPLGKDGYFEPLFDKAEGTINHEVAEYWREHYDLLHYLKTNWSSLGPKLDGKLHIYCGDMDNFYLNVAVQELQTWLGSTENPHVAGEFFWGDGHGHRFGREFSTEAERIRTMAEHVFANRPQGTPHPWWVFAEKR